MRMKSKIASKSLEQNTYNSLFLVFTAVDKINNVCKVHFVDNVLLSVQKGQVVHSLLCHGRAQDRFDTLHTTEASFSCAVRCWNSSTVTIFSQ